MSFVERCRKRHLGGEGEDEGFTLIELLVVLLIIGILLAIAIPTFLSVTKGAQSTSAQSNLTNSITGAKTYYTDSNQSFTGLLVPSSSTSTLSQIDDGLTYVSPGFATGGHNLAVQTGGGGTWLEFAAWAPGQNDCWLVFDNEAASNTGTVNNFPLATSGGTLGTYFAVIRGLTSDSGCKTDVTPSATSRNAFPSP
jgi:type IV pilus assembly protein PilA